MRYLGVFAETHLPLYGSRLTMWTVEPEAMAPGPGQGPARVGGPGIPARARRDVRPGLGGGGAPQPQAAQPELDWFDPLRTGAAARVSTVVCGAEEAVTVVRPCRTTVTTVSPCAS